VIYGPDVSHYQGAIDLRRARAEGMDFLIAKISQGAGMRDSRWPRNRDEGRAAGLLVAGYHYVTTEDPGAQARNCAGWLGDKSVPVALDHERGGGNINQLRATLAAFRAAGMRVVLTYCPPFYWTEIGRPALTGLPPLWKARYYTTGGSPQQLYAKTPAAFWDAYGGMTPVMLQFTDGATVAGMRVDANAFRGSRAELAALFGSTDGGTTPTPGGFLMALNDAEQAEMRDMLRNLHFQLVTGDGPKDHAGWQTFAGGSNERLTIVDYLRRANQKHEDILKALAGVLTAAQHAGGSGGVDPAVVEQVLREAVAAAGFELHGTIVPGADTRGAHGA